jgi:hypothetical protein
MKPHPPNDVPMDRVSFLALATAAIAFGKPPHPHQKLLGVTGLPLLLAHH